MDDVADKRTAAMHATARAERPAACWQCIVSAHNGLCGLAAAKGGKPGVGAVMRILEYILLFGGRPTTTAESEIAGQKTAEGLGHTTKFEVVCRNSYSTEPGHGGE